MCCLKDDAKPTMVFTADDLLDWKDFPKGLRVLLIDTDTGSAAEMRSRLEGMDYIVSAFGNEDEALSAITSKSECFHVAIVAVNTENSNGILKFLEAAKDLPILMISNNHCLSTMMKCIALGAVEVLQKPVSDDKLRNLWQHVVHKAFNAGGKDVSVKESMVSMLHLRLENTEEHERESVKEERISPKMEQNQDKFQAPSTPPKERSSDHEGCQALANLSVHEMDGECKSVETSCGISLSECSAFSSPVPEEAAAIKDEHESTGAGENKDQDQGQDLPSNKNGTCKATEPIKPSTTNDSCGARASRRKSKVDWTSELHKKFVKAVEHLGVDHAIPSRILELMKVEGLTRHNVASHLQKYRMHRRHILPKEPEHRWPQPGGPVHYPAHKPVMAYPQYHGNHNLPGAHVYPPWMPPNTTYPGGIHSWGSPCYPGWQMPNETWHWQPYPGVVTPVSQMHAEAWGCPVMPPPPPHPPVGSIHQFPQCAPDFQNPKEMQNAGNMFWDSCDLQLQPADEVVDKVVKEAISKPWLPLPLGLKPPSTESVLTELSKQGISTIPPQHSPDLGQALQF